MEAMKIISLTRGQVALVDDADHAALSKFKWHAHKRRCGKWEACRHKVAVRAPTKSGWRSVNMTMPEHLIGIRRGLTIDHKDGDPLNNQRANLRFATHVQQSQNRMKPNKLGVKGVFCNGGGYAARIKVGTKRVYIGTFATLELAAQEYNNAARVHFGEFARLNLV